MFYMVRWCGRIVFGSLLFRYWKVDLLNKDYFLLLFFYLFYFTLFCFIFFYFIFSSLMFSLYFLLYFWHCKMYILVTVKIRTLDDFSFQLLLNSIWNSKWANNCLHDLDPSYSKAQLNFTTIIPCDLWENAATKKAYSF